MRRLVAAITLLAALLASGCGGRAAGCESVEASAPRPPETRSAPSEPLDAGTAYTLVFETSCGAFTVALDQELAPNTAASLVSLARGGFYDDTILHRVVPGFVVQGGDPTQTGAGGPGYATTDVPPSDAQYVRGTFAMAKAVPEPPGTAGSQFFVVTAETTTLTPVYAIVGEVSEGMDTIDRIDALGVGNGPPSRPVVVERVTVGEG